MINSNDYVNMPYFAHIPILIDLKRHFEDD